MVREGRMGWSLMTPNRTLSSENAHRVESSAHGQEAARKAGRQEEQVERVQDETTGTVEERVVLERLLRGTHQVEGLESNGKCRTEKNQQRLRGPRPQYAAPRHSQYFWLKAFEKQYT